MQIMIRRKAKAAVVPGQPVVSENETVQIDGTDYRLGPLDEQQNLRIFVLPDLSMTIGEQWERGIRTSTANAGNPISDRDLESLPYPEMQKILHLISTITLAAAAKVYAQTKR